MHDSDTRRLDTFPTATGGITRLAYERAVGAGIDVERLLKAASLTRSQVEDRGTRIEVQQQIRFLNLVADSLHDEHLGFHLAQTPDPRELGLLYYVAASSPTLGDALRQSSRYTAVVDEGLALRYKKGQTIRVAFELVDVARRTARHEIEFCVTILVRMLRQLSGSHLIPSRVKVIHHRGGVCPELSAFFGVAVEFGAKSDEIAFAKQIENIPIVSADPYLHNLAMKCGEQALARLASRRGSTRAKVENAIIPLLSHGKARAGEIARHLGLSQRTLARLLAAEGTSFSGVLEGLRRELARQYLADPSISISHIAWLLGYQEVSAFSHAFARWNGMTPRKARESSWIR